MTIAETLLLDFDPEMHSVRRVLERIPDQPENSTFRPHPKSMAMGRLAAHVSILPMFGITILTTPNLALENHKFPPLVFESTEKLLADFAASSEECRAALTAASDDQLTQHWKMTWGDKTLAEGPRARVYRTMFLNHIIHHRAQLTVYLRLNEVPVPGLYGPSADEQ